MEGADVNDTTLELRLAVLAHRLCLTTNHKDYAPLWREFVVLHGQRSAGQVERRTFNEVTDIEVPF